MKSFFLIFLFCQFCFMLFLLYKFFFIFFNFLSRCIHIVINLLIEFLIVIHLVSIKALAKQSSCHKDIALLFFFFIGSQTWNRPNSYIFIYEFIGCKIIHELFLIHIKLIIYISFTLIFNSCFYILEFLCCCSNQLSPATVSIPYL